MEMDFMGALLEMSMGFLAVLGAVILAAVMDFASAAVTSRKLGIRLRSAKMRHGLDKLMRYMMFVGVFFAADMLIAISGRSTTPWCSVAAGLAVVAVEVVSVVEHSLQRRDKIGKLPEVLHEAADWLGEERMKELAAAMMKYVERKMKEEKKDEKD